MTLLRRFPLLAYFVLAFAINWGLVFLARYSILFALLALFGPTTAAVLVTRAVDGADGVRALLGRVVDYRVPPMWFAVAIGLPIILTLVAVGLHMLIGGEFQLSRAGAAAWLIAFLVVGEEIGWRGFALPRLRARMGGLAASLVLGLLWAAWHLANATLPGFEFYVTAFPAFTLFVVSQTILFAWIATHTRGSLLLAWIFHAAINLSGAVLAFGTTDIQWWLSGLAFAAAAVIVVFVPGALDRKPAPYPPKSTT